jgi:hypothetical protein
MRDWDLVTRRTAVDIQELRPELSWAECCDLALAFWACIARGAGEQRRVEESSL